MIWTDQEIDNYREENLSTEAIGYVCKLLKERKKISIESNCDLLTILDNMGLRGSSGSMTIAAAILFSKKPDIYAPGTNIKIGKFDDHNELVGEDIIDGPLILQPEGAIEILFMKYIWNRYTCGDLFRDVKFEYPRRACQPLPTDDIKGILTNRVEMQSWDYAQSGHMSGPDADDVFHRIPNRYHDMMGDGYPEGLNGMIQTTGCIGRVYPTHRISF